MPDPRRTSPRHASPGQPAEAKPPDLTSLAAPALLALYVAIHEEFGRRGIARSKNVVGDYAEALAVRALGLIRASKSAKNHDATDAEGRQYEVKGRWLTPANPSRQLGDLPTLDTQPAAFDFLVGVLFSGDIEVFRAALVPAAIVRPRLRPHGARFRMLLVDDVWDEPGVADLTIAIQAAAREIAAEVIVAVATGDPTVLDR